MSESRSQKVLRLARAVNGRMMAVGGPTDSELREAREYQNELLQMLTVDYAEVLSRTMDDLYRVILLQGPKQCGSYDPDEALVPYEESLTGAQYDELAGFLRYVRNNGLSFGHGNLDTVWTEYQAQKD